MFIYLFVDWFIYLFIDLLHYILYVLYTIIFIYLFIIYLYIYIFIFWFRGVIYIYICVFMATSHGSKPRQAQQISTEKEALLRSLALLRERQKAPVAGTPTRVGTDSWPI